MLAELSYDFIIFKICSESQLQKLLDLFMFYVGLCPSIYKF